MAGQPFYSLKNRDWRIKVSGTTEAELIEAIPGLYQVPPDLFRGSVDAVAAACRLLKVAGPALPTPEAAVTHLPLKEYQVEGVGTLTRTLELNGGALLADDMGLGKTLQTIATFNSLNCERILIAAPRFLSFGWSDELTKWGEPNHVVLTSGETKRHKANWEKAKTAKWVITSYEMLPRAAAECFSDSPPWALAFDEAHMVKNSKSQRTQFAKDLATMVPFKLAITATPMWNRPQDFYGILNTVLPNRWGSRTQFFVRYCNGRINEHGGLEAKGATNEEEL